MVVSADYNSNMVNKRVLTGIVLLFILFTSFAGAQESEIFAPFVSQIEGEIRNNLIRLTWKDSPDIRGPVFIYRSESPFSVLSVFPAPVEIPYGIGSYLDEAEQPGVLYYFVVASDEWGRKYTLYIPSANMVNVTVGSDNVPSFFEYSDVYRQVPPGRQTGAVASSIDGISARIEDNRVIISFSGADRTKNLILYRSLNPIRRQEDLLSAQIIRQRVNSPVIDHPLPGITYHYALVYEEDISSGLFSIQPGSNATGAVQIHSVVPGSRELPLPELSTWTLRPYGLVGSSASFLPESIDPGPETVSSSLERRIIKTVMAEPAVFSEDLEMDGVRGEENQLRTIVQSYFSLKEWDNAEEEFRRFLGLPRTKLNQAKARFYLGQVYYFQEKFRDALFMFLQAQDEFPQESNLWIQAILSEFARN